jgi:hypothetical protein
MNIRSILKTKSSMIIDRPLSLLVLLPLLLLCSSLVLLSPSSSSNAAEGDETRTTVSETTEIENLGSGLEQHTTTTVEDVVTEGKSETTGQLLNNRGFEDSTSTSTVPNWDTSGSVNVCDTCGPFGGNALQTGPEPNGGTVSQSVDLFTKMNEQEINEGFTMNYGSHVFSHQSNETVPACDSDPTNGPDCRDTFSITLDIKDSGGVLLHKFEHEFKEITWTGWNTTDFFFNSTVPKNEYTSAIATLELFGIDSGFTNGFFGPAFDNVALTVTHTNMIVEQITTITEELIQTAIETIEDTSTIDTTDVAEVETTSEPEVVESFEITVSDGFGETIDNFEISVDNNMEITIEPIGPEPTAAEVEIETTVAEVETQIEAEVETQVAEVSTEAEPEPEPQPTETTENDTGDSEPTDTASTDAEESQEESGADESNESESKSESKPKTKSEVRKTKSESKEQRKKAIATRVVTKIISKLGTDAASQATQLALMNAIGANLSAAAPNLQDASAWYASSQIPDNVISDPSAVLFSSAQDNIMNGLVNSQYQ